MWIGIVDEIDGMLTDNTVKLNVGDTALLFTNGITEAWRKESVKDERDPEEDMYGQERLIRVFTETGDRSPEEIKNAILDSLTGYTCADDITMVVLKRVE